MTRKTENKTNPTRTITIGILAPTTVTLKVTKDNESTWNIVGVVTKVANDLSPRMINESLDEDTLDEIDRLAELAEDDS